MTMAGTVTGALIVSHNVDFKVQLLSNSIHQRTLSFAHEMVKFQRFHELFEFFRNVHMQQSKRERIEENE